MRRLVWTLICLIVLLVIADRLAWKLAEGEVASRIQSSEHLTRQPDVSIHGFPFLTQVLAGRYEGVDANVEDLTVDRGAMVDHVRAHLAGLDVPLQALIKRDLNTIPVDSGTVTGTVSFSSLDAAAKANLPGDALTVQFARGRAGTSNEIALTGTYSAGRLKVQLSGNVSIIAQDGRLVISIPPNSLDVPSAVRSDVARLLGTSYPLPALPLGLKITRVSVGDSGVAISAAGSNLMIGTSGLG